MSDRQSSSPSSFSMSSLYSNLPDRFAAALAAFIGADRGQSPPPTDAWKIRFPCITANLEQLSVSATISSSSDEISREEVGPLMMNTTLVSESNKSTKFNSNDTWIDNALEFLSCNLGLLF